MRLITEKVSVGSSPVIIGGGSRIVVQTMCRMYPISRLYATAFVLKASMYLLLRIFISQRRLPLRLPVWWTKSVSIQAISIRTTILRGSASVN